MLYSEKVKHRGTTYVVREFSHSDLEIAQAYIKRMKIKDNVLAAFVMLSQSCFFEDGKPVFKKQDYKKAKTDFSISLLDVLSKRMNKLNNFGAVEKIEGN